MKKYFIPTIFLLLAVSIYQTSEVFAQEYKKLGRIYKVNPNRDIIINSPNAAQVFNMGDKVYIIIDSKPVIMTVTFPMMTIAKCRLNAGYENYFNSIYKGLQVYNYEIGIENKVLTDRFSSKNIIGNSSIIITASENSAIYYLNSNDWETILEIIMKSYGKKLPDSYKIKNETIKSIKNPSSSDLQINLTDIAYTIGDSGEKTPGIIKNLNAGDYYVWIVNNDKISVKNISLKNGHNLILDFKDENKTIEAEKKKDERFAEKSTDETYKSTNKLLNHGMAILFTNLFFAGLQLEKDKIYNTYEIYFQYDYYFFNWCSLGVQLGYDINPSIQLGAVGSRMLISFEGKGSANFDLNPMWSFYIPVSKFFVPIIALGFGLSMEGISLYDNTFKYPRFSNRYLFLFNLKADVGFDIHWNEHGAVRILANFNYTTNPYIYYDLVYNKPWFTFSLGLYFKF